MPTVAEAVAELAAEHADLDALLQTLTEDEWRAPTPAAGWDVRDQVSHLADTNEICVDTITGGPRPLNTAVSAFDSPEAFTESGCARGRSLTPNEVLDWWRTSAAATRAAISARGDKDRIPWGLGMSAPMMATARLMEHWAHACDVHAAVGRALPQSPRLRTVAFITLRAVPYALSYAKIESPPGALRAELSYGSETWELGPDDSDNVITGDAFEFCRLGIRRIARAEALTLKASGLLAEAALDNLRAFL